MKNFLLFVLLMPLFFSACSSVQVFEIASTQVEQYEDDVFAFENEDLAIAYDFWIDGGIMLFNVTNKTQEDIFVDFSKSQFIINGAIFDFYNDLYLPSAIQVNNTEILPPKLEKIPSQSSETIEGFPITFDWQKMKKKHQAAIYGKENSPFQFTNRIIYSKEASFKNELVLENAFWVNQIEKLNRKEFKAIANSNSPKSDKFYVRRIQQVNPTLFWVDVGLAVLETAVLIAN